MHQGNLLTDNLVSFASVGHFLLLPLGFLFHHFLFYFEIFLEFLFRSLSVCDTPARILLSSPTLDTIVRWSFLFTQAFHDLILTVFLVFHFCFHDCPLHAFFAMLPYHLLIIHLDIVLFLFSASMCVLHLSPLCLVTVDIHKACM